MVWDVTTGRLSEIMFQVLMPPDERLTRVKAAVETTSAAGTARVVVAASVGEPIVDAESIRGDGIADIAGRRVLIHESMLTPGGMEELSPASQRGPRILRRVAAALYDVTTGRDNHLYDGGAVYAELGEGEWIDFEWGQRADPPHINHPLWLLDALRGTSDGIEDFGDEQLRGKLTRHLGIRLDLEAASRQTPQGLTMPKEKRRWRSELTYARVSAQVWLDAADRVARMSWALPAKPPTLWTTTELWEFGVSIDELEAAASNTTR